MSTVEVAADNFSDVWLTVTPAGTAVVTTETRDRSADVLLKYLPSCSILSASCVHTGNRTVITFYSINKQECVGSVNPNSDEGIVSLKTFTDCNRED